MPKKQKSTFPQNYRIFSAIVSTFLWSLLFVCIAILLFLNIMPYSHALSDPADVLVLDSVTDISDYGLSVRVFQADQFIDSSTVVDQKQDAFPHEEKLKQILDKYPDYYPAQVLLAKEIAQRGLKESAGNMINRVLIEYPEYWYAEELMRQL